MYDTLSVIGRALYGPHWDLACTMLAAGLIICVGILRLGYWLRYPPGWLRILRGSHARVGYSPATPPTPPGEVEIWEPLYVPDRDTDDDAAG